MNNWRGRGKMLAIGGRYPVVPAVSVACFAAVLVNMVTSQTAEALAGTGFALTGAAVYGLFLRRPERGGLGA